MAYLTKNILIHQKFEPELEIYEYIGEPFPGDGFFGKSDGMHTFQYLVTDFVGTLVIQGTLVFEPEETDWSTVHSKEYDLLNESDNSIDNVIGNFIWVRACIKEWEHGTVNIVRMKH